MPSRLTPMTGHWLNQIAIIKHSPLSPPTTGRSGGLCWICFSRMYHFTISLGPSCNLLASTVKRPVDESADQIGEVERGFDRGPKNLRLARTKFVVQVSCMSTAVVR